MYFSHNDRTQSAPNSAMHTVSPGYISPGPATATGGGQFSMGFSSPEPHQHPSYQQQHQQNHPGQQQQNQPNQQQQPAQEHPNPLPLRRRPSIVGSTFSSTDSQSMKTVTSTTSSEKRRQEKIKVNSEVRVRGRGGVQNIGKKEKEKAAKKEEKKKKDKKSRFPTGSGLAGIRGFV